MRKLNKSLLMLVLCSAVGSLGAQVKTEMSLADAKGYTLEHHLGIQNAEYDSQIAIQKKNETRGIGLPQANLSGSFNNFLNLPVQVVGANFINPNAKPGETIAFKAGTDYNATGTFQVNQILFNGSYLVGLQVSKLYVEFQRTFEQQSKEDAIFNVIQAYQLAAVAKDNLNFIDSLVTVTSDLVEKQSNYYELGLMKQEDMDQLSYSLLTARNAQKSADIQYKNAMSMLKLAMNYPMDQDLVLTENSNQLMLGNNLVSEGSIENNLTLGIMEKQKVLNEYNLKNYRYANLPTLNAVFQQAYNAYRNEFNFFANQPWYSQTLWGLQLNVPLYSGGQRHARIQQAKIEVMKSENSLKLYEQNLKFQEVQAKNNLLGAQEKYALQEANVELAGKIYNNSLVKEKIGSESSILVTQKYNQLVLAQSQLVASKLEVFNAKLSLEKLYNQILTTK